MNSQEQNKMKLEYLNEGDDNSSPSLGELVEPDSDLKNILIEYTGEALSPDNDEVTLEMIVEVVASEFPEFVLALAEENWIRGYQQALDDVELGRKFAEDDK